MTTNNQPDELDGIMEENIKLCDAQNDIYRSRANAKKQVNALIDKKWKAGYDSGVEDTHELHATPRLQPINYSQEQLDKAVREARIDELKAYDEQPTYESGDDYVTKRLTELQNNQHKKGEDNE